MVVMTRSGYMLPAFLFQRCHTSLMYATDLILNWVTAAAVSANRRSSCGTTNARVLPSRSCYQQLQPLSQHSTPATASELLPSSRGRLATHQRCCRACWMSYWQIMMLTVSMMVGEEAGMGLQMTAQ